MKDLIFRNLHSLKHEILKKSRRVIFFRFLYFPYVSKGSKNRAVKLGYAKFLEKNINYIRQIALNNSYPKTLVNNILNNNLLNNNLRRMNRQNIQTEDNLQVKYLKIPLIRGLSGQLINQLKSENINIITYPMKTVNDLFSKLKEKRTLQINLT